MGGARCRSPEDLCRLAVPHYCGVDGARCRSPERSVYARRTPLLGRRRSSLSPRGKKDCTYSSLQEFDWPVIALCTTDGGHYFAYYFFHYPRLATRYARKYVHTQVCMYGHTYGKSMDQPGKVASPARGQLNRKTEYFSVRVRPCLRIWSLETDSAVQSRVNPTLILFISARFLCYSLL